MKAARGEPRTIAKSRGRLTGELDGKMGRPLPKKKGGSSKGFET